MVEIPANFSRDIVRGDAARSSGRSRRDRSRGRLLCLAAFNSLATTALRDDLVGPLAARAQGPPPFNVVSHLLYNPESITQYNIVPGLLAVILTMTMVLMTCLALTRERERGTYENLLAMPATPLEIMIGKITPNIMIGAVQSTIILLVAKIVFHVPMIGSLGLLAVALGCLHHRQSRGRLHLLDHRPEPAAGDADDDVLPAARDPAVGLRLSLQGHAASGRNGSARCCPPRISCASSAASCSRITAWRKSGPICGRCSCSRSSLAASLCCGSGEPWIDPGFPGGRCPLLAQRGRIRSWS